LIKKKLESTKLKKEAIEKTDEIKVMKTKFRKLAEELKVII